MILKFPQPVLDFFKEPNYMVLGTLRQDGSIQMTIVWFEYDHGLFKISTTGSRIKYKNMTADPRVTFVIYDRGNPYRFVQVQAKVKSFTREGGHDMIDKLSARYTGSKTYKRDPERKEDRVTFTLEPLRYSAVGFTDPNQPNWISQ